MPEELLYQHHEFSPSRLGRIEKCPPSWKLCKDFVSEASDDASRGTLMHEAMFSDDALAKLSEADRGIVQNLREEHVKPFASANVTTYNELEVEVRDDDGSLLTRGKLDYLIVSADGKVGSLMDFKFGSYEVESAETNPQMWGYIAGVFQKFPTLEKMYAMIVQPVYGIGNYDKQAEFTRADLPRMVERIRSIENRAKAADLSDLSQYHCGTDCRFCNKIACQKYREWMRGNMALLSISELPREIAVMTVDYADKVKEASKAIAAEMKPVVELAEKVILEGGGSEHYRVCNGRTTRKTDWKALCEKYGITDDDIAACTTETVSKPYLQVRMGRKTKRLNDAEA